MNIQAEKLELIRQIADINSESLLKKIKSLISSTKNVDETERIVANSAMSKRLKESRQQVKEGKTTKISLDEIWK